MRPTSHRETVPGGWSLHARRMARVPWLLAVAVAQAVAVAGAATLETPRATLTLDERGVRVIPKDPACPAVDGTGAPVWRLVVQTSSGPVTLSSLGQSWTQEQTADGFRVAYETIADESTAWKIGVTLNFRRKQDAIEIDGELRNGGDGVIVSGFDFVALAGLAAQPGTHPLLWPNGLGQRFGAGGKGNEHTFAYPGRTGTMQWCAFAGAEGGMYAGCHDASHGAKTFASRFDAATGRSTLEIRFQPFCPAGGRWPLPPVVLLPYRGTWHTAARFYRAWYDSVTSLRVPPGWAHEASGWLLCILKQQNGLVMWDYPALGQLADLAGRRGLDVLGLFGWAEGGHDHLYPDYIPSPRMGGPEALRQGLREIRQRGKRSILYANGQLMDMATEYYLTQGKDQAVIKEDGTPVRQDWQKFRSFPPVRCALACQAADGWHQRMLQLARQAQELGADGILFDQLGVTGPMLCWGKNHGHPAPSMVYAGERAAWVRDVADEMTRVAPEFLVMTEGLHDSVLDSVAMFHGCMAGVFTPTAQELRARWDGSSAEAAFPEMFRYTFPEVLITQRHPTPMLSRLAANYACVYGLRYEIESRYAPDVRYLKEGVIPTRADYADVLNPPDVAMMNGTHPEESARYLSLLVAFQKRHAALLLSGRFNDSCSIEFDGKGLIAKAYEAGDRTGVLVWNPGGEPGAFALSVPGARLVEAVAPESGHVEPFDPLPAQAIRLLVWQRSPHS